MRMAQPGDIVDLSKLGLKPGGATHLDFRVAVGEFKFSDQAYKLEEDPTSVALDISRSNSGNIIRVRLKNTLSGPCMRCHGDFDLPVSVDHSEVHEPQVDPEMASEYVQGHELDLPALVRDAIGLALPTTISSPVDANGICTDCVGADERLSTLFDRGGGERVAQPDPRWAKLRELEFENHSERVDGIQSSD